MQFFSHPGIILADHLLNVAKNIDEQLSDLNLHDLPINIVKLRDTAIIIGLFHDFGKYTSFFQDHLFKGLKSEYSNHSFLSSIIAWEFLRQFDTNGINNSNFTNFLPTIGMEVIRRHHGDLENFCNEFQGTNLNNQREFSIIKTQIGDLLNRPETLEHISADFINLFVYFGIDYTLDQCRTFFIETLQKYLNKTEFNTLFEFQYKIFRKFQMGINKKTIEPLENYCFFFLTQLLFSLLIDSDKKVASQIDETYKHRLTIPSNSVDEYKRIIFTVPKAGSVNELRESFYSDVIAPLEKNPESFLNRSIFSITAPTGIGKTLTVFSFALRLRNILTQTCSSPPRIIYCLPFTSIIDQNYQVFSDVLQSTLSDFEVNPEKYLLKHHHLSEIRYHIQGEELSNEDALLLTEAWDSEIIVTTFYQLFYTIFGYENSSLKKYGKLCNSIIILDEIQSFPPKYWRILRSVLLYITRFSNTKVIFLTATQPAILLPNEINELVPNPFSYYQHQFLDRIQFTCNFESKTIDSMLESFNVNPIEHQSYLFVLNTIQSSMNVTQYFLSHYPNIHPITEYEDKNLEELQKYSYIPNEFILIYLSTNIPPIVRQKRIVILNLFIKQKVPFIAVSTQLIEAGVDIDAEIVVRDFGPLDSLIQVAGRCNRNNRFPKGQVSIVNLVNEKNDPYYEYVYDATFITITTKILTNEKKNHPFPWNEGQFANLFPAYFQAIRTEIENTKSYQNLLIELMFGTRNPTNENQILSIRDFRIIQNEFDVIEIYLLMNQESRDLYRQYLELKKNLHSSKIVTNFYDIKATLHKISQKMQSYLIKVPKYLATNLNDLTVCDNWIILDIFDQTLLYDNLVGFCRKILE